MLNRIFGSQLLFMVMLLGLLTSCEKEDSLIGYDVVGDNAAQLDKAYVQFSTQNILSDTIRSDRRVLANATIGAFNDPVFGKTKSAFYTQVRLATLNPKFGNNAQVDSVILKIPVYAITKDTVSYSRNLYDTKYTLNNKDGNCSIVDTLTQYFKFTKYKMDSIYGNRNSTMELRVHRVTENMGTIDSVYYSNKNFQTGELFGTKTIDDKVIRETLVQYKTSTKKDSIVIRDDRGPSIKMKLDGMREFIQDQIVNQQGSSNLNDQISFISNVLNGIKIDVADDDGFIFNVAQDRLSLVAYISSDNPAFKDENGNGIHDNEENCPQNSILPKKTESFELLLGSSINAASNKYYNVTQNAITHSNGSLVDNDNVLYLKGMGGAKVKLSLNENDIASIKDHVANDGWVINEAHIKVYPAKDVQNSLILPQYLYLYNHTQNKVLPDYGNANNPGKSEDFQGFPFNQIALPYNAEKGYYLLRCTEFVKNIIEKNQPIDDLMLELGAFTGDDDKNLFFTPLSPFNSDKIYNPYRLAIVGNNPNSMQENQKLQLEILYSKKNK